MSRVSVSFSSFFDELKDHHGAEHFCDRTDPVSRHHRQRFLFGSVDLAVADNTGVKNVPGFGNGEAPHRLILFGEAVKKLVEFGFARRL